MQCRAYLASTIRSVVKAAWSQRLWSACASCMVAFLVSAGVLLLAVGSPVSAAQSRDERLQECRVLYARIDHFTQLRRAGGSAQRMATWKSSLRRVEKDFRERRCHRFSSRYLRSQ